MKKNTILIAVLLHALVSFVQDKPKTTATGDTTQNALLNNSISEPLVTEIFTADPSAHVFNGKIYIYPSHDIDAGIAENDNGDHFAMAPLPSVVAEAVPDFDLMEAPGRGSLSSSTTVPLIGLVCASADRQSRKENSVRINSFRQWFNNNLLIIDS